jgi:L-ascorbate metabolism protein UlaG (beta-lactamase superfamily)
MEQPYKVTYISNAGVMLECNNSKIIIDGFSTSLLPMFKSPTYEMKERMTLGTHPFENIKALLFTHHHPDHFDADSTMSYLNNNRDTIMLAPQNIVSDLEQKFPHIERKRLIKIMGSLDKTETININGINIKTASMLHEGNEYSHVHNIAYLIEIEGKKVLHVGDAKPYKDNYLNMNFVKENIDLLIVPFPYIALPSARTLIELYISPKKIAVVHLPYKELDTKGWINATMKSYKRVEGEFIETVFFENIGDYINI